jgi:hypothetical protein
MDLERRTGADLDFRGRLRQWQKMAAVATPGSVFLSTNSGATWTSNSVSAAAQPWLFIRSSADGSGLVVVSDNGPVFTSTNSGTTWQPAANAPNYQWQSVALSASGTELILAGSPSLIYFSTDSGLTWKSNGVSGVTSWQCLATSADGGKWFASDPSNFIYASTNLGLTWTQIAHAAGSAFTCSADGARMTSMLGSFYSGPFISTSGSGIFRFYTPPSPQLNVRSLNNGVRVSWLVPATNLNLQANFNLATTNWVAVTNMPTLNLTNLNNEVFLSPTNHSGFFRLATP